MKSIVRTFGALWLVAALAAPSSAQEGNTCFLYPATIVGTEGDDVITGTAESDVIVGLGGNDVIDGGAGQADRICGGDGNDEISDPDGYRLRGDAGNDMITVGEPSPMSFASGTLVGDEGDDVLRTTPGAFGSYLRPGPGNDTIEAEGDRDKLDYSSAPVGVNVDLEAGTATGHGRDTLSGTIESVVGSPYDDTILGSSADDYIDGYRGDDFLSGRDGSDSFLVGRGKDRIKGKLGSDWVIAVPELERFLTVNLKFNYLRVLDGPRTHLESIENADGGFRLIGNVMNNQLYGGPRRDFIDGKRGDDTIKPGGGGDRVWTGVGNDLVTGCAGGKDRVHLGPGNDVMDAVGSQECGHQPGLDRIDGGSGRDLVTYETWWDETAVIADLKRGACIECDRDGRTRFTDIEDLRGSNNDDKLRGDGNANALFGGNGNDVLNGRGGRDELDGGDGIDDCRNGETVVRCE